MIADHTRSADDLSPRPLEWDPPRPAISRVPYLPGLDGMRALAVVAVMLYHANSEWLGGGFIGVEVFFVISGYLITLLLIGEHERSGHIDVKQFWLRRARRLLPALFVLVAALLVYCALFKRVELGNTRGDVIAGLGYVSNWYQIWVGQGYTATEDFAPLRHLWSLAVEEQFYLVWPLVMIGLIGLGRRRLPDVSRWLILAALLIAIGVGVAFHGGDPSSPAASWEIAGRAIQKNDALYLSTITRATGLAIGAAFAMLWRPVAVMRGPLRNRGRELGVLAIIGLAGLAALSFVLKVVYDDGSGDPWLYRGGFLAVSLCTVMVIAAVTHRGSAAGPLLGNTVLAWIGQRSYGLYLFHWPIYQIIRERAGAKMSVGEFVLAMAITVPVTEASYRFIETPVRKRQLEALWCRITERDDPRPRQAVVIGATLVVALVGFGAVSMAGAKVEGNWLQRQLASNESATVDPDQIGTGSEPAGPTTTTASTPTVAPDAGAVTPVATPTTAAPTTTKPTPSVIGRLAIGDSVMKGAATTLKNDLGFTVVAEESQQFDHFVPIVEQFVAKGQLDASSIVVIHLGTNGTIQQDDAVEILDSLKGVAKIVMITDYAQRSWIDKNNELIRSFEGRNGNVTVLNWDALVAGCKDWAIANGGSGDCLAGDNIHLSKDGINYYAELIASTAGLT